MILNNFNILLIISLTCFLSYRNMKYFILAFTIVYLLLYLIRGLNFKSFFTWYFLFAGVVYASSVGLIVGNDISRVGYDFYTIFYALLGILIVNKCKNFDQLTSVIETSSLYLATVFTFIIVIYIFFIFVYGINGLIPIAYILELYELPFNFAGGGKLVTDYSPLLLVVLPFALYDKKIIIIPLLLTILLSVSFTQYLIFLFNILFLGVIFGVKRVVLYFFLALILILSLILINPEILIDITSKYFNFTFENNDPATSGLYSRIIQAEVLFNEFLEAPFLGKGLGYVSIEYNHIRQAWGDFPDRNLSMYENQYLDILMKFGIFGSTFIIAGYVFLPLYNLINIKKNLDNNIGKLPSFIKLLFMALLNLYIYVGSNGNQWYAPISMLSWGLLIGIIYKISNNIEQGLQINE